MTTSILDLLIGRPADHDVENVQIEQFFVSDDLALEFAALAQCRAVSPPPFERVSEGLASGFAHGPGGFASGL